MARSSSTIAVSSCTAREPEGRPGFVSRETLAAFTFPRDLSPAESSRGRGLAGRWTFWRWLACGPQPRGARGNAKGAQQEPHLFILGRVQSTDAVASLIRESAGGKGPSHDAKYRLPQAVITGAIRRGSGLATGWAALRAVRNPQFSVCACV